MTPYILILVAEVSFISGLFLGNGNNRHNTQSTQGMGIKQTTNRCTHVGECGSQTKCAYLGGTFYIAYPNADGSDYEIRTFKDREYSSGSKDPSGSVGRVQKNAKPKSKNRTNRRNDTARKSPKQVKG